MGITGLYHSITLQTVNNINDKLNWSIRSLDKIKFSQHNKIEIQDNFWTFLTAFHSGWNYYNRLISLLYSEISKRKQSEKANILIVDWKNKELTEAEKSSWNILNKLRNSDMHNEPIKPEIIEREYLLTADVGIYLVDEQGQFLSTGTITKIFSLL